MNDSTIKTLAHRIDVVERENRRLKRAGVAVPLTLVAAVVLLWTAVPAVGGLRSDYEAAYQGEPLGDAISGIMVSIVYGSNLVDRTGYDTQSHGKTVVSSSFGKENRQSVWIISIRGNDATVMDGQGNIGRYAIIKRDSSGVILMGVAKGVSVQVITIDPRNSSFVYTTQNVNVMWNRANTFVGGCRPGGP